MSLAPYLLVVECTLAWAGFYQLLLGFPVKLRLSLICAPVLLWTSGCLFPSFNLVQFCALCGLMLLILQIPLSHCFIMSFILRPVGYKIHIVKQPCDDALYHDAGFECSQCFVGLHPADKLPALKAHTFQVQMNITGFIVYWF